MIAPRDQFDAPAGIGDVVPFAKLRAIREAHAAGADARDLAVLFGVSVAVVRWACTRETLVRESRVRITVLRRGDHAER